MCVCVWGVGVGVGVRVRSWDGETFTQIIIKINQVKLIETTLLVFPVLLPSSP